ncbi:LolA family protein [Pontibaca salina]|uniref:Outer membrane lipoprotein carrier protein LolA n=1 Tax=Pontibaca salina TaxID=2795731 RepID=A0A934HSD4_9RHOB|nr:outer membrane lipoprotein carrier protein LolA [Pontibaca salina]MBI6629670.1 outer membrane lipoprotein carrier protein LolA [Pontibaca salina]
MKKLVLAAALILSAPSAWAEGKLSLSEISQYLNGMTTAQAPFTQINDDGSLSTGKLYIHRPGRMRFQYEKPNNAVVMAGGGTVVIQDPKSNQPPESYPLKRTPLSIILQRNVDLGRANMVVGHSYDGTSTIVTAQDPEHPDYGNIELMFTGNPVELRKWVINDSSGTSTTVILGVLETDMRLNSNLFTPPHAGSSGGR